MRESSEHNVTATPQTPWVLYIVSVLIVIIGMINSIPGIPGLDSGVKSLTGLDWLVIRKFPTEWFYPIVFAVLMLCVVLKHSVWREWTQTKPRWRKLGFVLDAALLVAAFGISLTYLIEIESVCLIDTINGDRARLLAESLKKDIDLAEMMGLPAPTTVDDPKCLNNTGGWIVAIVGAAVLIFLTYNIKVWGLPLVIVALAVALFTIFTVLVWYFYGAEDVNKYLMTKLGGEPRLLSDGRPRVHDILVNNASGLLGRFLDIMLNTIFPYLVLGSLFGASAGGQSLIKIAFRWTRRLRGGPAHAAICSSAMFGTISGGPIVNVLSTGVLTIPMMLKRGFDRVFAGGVEAAASSGGSIMPPVMGVAAFVLSALTVVPYSDVIVAAIIPALAYFLCMFLSVVFQARKQGIVAIGEVTEEMRLNKQDLLNLVMIFGPILLILFMLISTKETIGCGIFGTILGAERTIIDGTCRVTDLPWIMEVWQNAAGDAGSAGWWAVILLIGLLFLDPEVRNRPRKVIDSLSEAGILVSTLYLMFLAVSVIDFCLQFTGLPTFISLDILSWLQTLNLGQDGSYAIQLMALAVTMVIAIVLGMGMPAVPAYVNVALLMGPVLAGLGLSLFTAHMFIFYFAVASAITPPVAVAAFAAASITKADAMSTGVAAVKSGFVMFFIPFVFAMYPEILLIDEAVRDPLATAKGTVAYLPGYDGNVDWQALCLLLARLVLALYLLSSALNGFDMRKLKNWEILARMALATLILFKSPVVFTIAVVAGLAIIGLHRFTVQKTPSAA